MRRARMLAVVLLTLALGVVGCDEDEGVALFASPQADPIALSADGSRLYVANTTSNSVSVIDTATLTEIAEIPVGVEPVSVELRPDGTELWVANHVSDTISVIDLVPGSPTFHQVSHTISALTPVAQGGTTLGDEPVDIAFASNGKAYVALSSQNQIGVVNANTYTGVGLLDITAQDPRAIAVRNGRLFVVAFESQNRSELSACLVGGNPPQCTFGFQDLLQVATNPNLPGVPKNIVQDPDLPDRDLFVFDTATDQLVGAPIETVGTLLYGIAVSSDGRVFVTNTDARNHNNDGNGLAAPPPDGLGLGLADLENRIFRNRITRIDCSGGSCSQASVTPFDLEPPPGSPIPAGTQLATPFGIEIAGDDSLLVITAAASSRIATVDPNTGAVLARLDVGAIPRGIALRSDPVTGAPVRAYVLNTLDNSVSAVDVAPGSGALTLAGTVSVGSDPTPENVRLGRIAFNSAEASSSGTFACASCHPDAGVDQLLWVIGASCDFGCDQEEPRLTMPVRGLRETLPLHWDGTLGDPVGGPNGEVGVGGSAPPNCDPNDPHSCFRQLADASLSGVMCTQPNCPVGPSGLPGNLDDTERDNLATFLASVVYMPARSRRIDDQLTTSAVNGFADFFMDQGGNGGQVANTCGDTTGGCHALPLGVSTNSPVVGAFDAPTWRGMTDRYIQFSSGFTAPEEIISFATPLWNPAQGFDELATFDSAFVVFTPVYNVTSGDIFQMFEEASTGFSGALGRQVTLNQTTVADPETGNLLAALEAADEKKLVNLRGVGIRNGSSAILTYWNFCSPSPCYTDPDRTFFLTHDEVIAEAQAGTLHMTFTAHLPFFVGWPNHPQPLLAPANTGSGPTGDPDLPVLPGDNPMRLQGISVREKMTILVDGQPVSGTIACVGGNFDSGPCSSEVVDIELDVIPPNGAHVLQVGDQFGWASNELPFCVGSVAGCL